MTTNSRLARTRVDAWALVCSGRVGPIIAFAVTTLVISVLPVVSMVVLADLVQRVPAAVNGGADSPEARALLLALTVLVALFAANQLVTQLSSVLGHWVTRDVDGTVKARAIRAATRDVGVREVESPALSHHFSLLAGRSLFPTGGSAAVAIIRTSGRYVQATAAAALLWTYHPIAAIAVVLVNLAMRRYLLHQYASPVRAAVAALPHLHRADYQTELLTDLPPGKETRVFQLQAWLLQRQALFHDQALDTYWRLGDHLRGQLFALFSCWWVAYGLLYVQITVAVTHGEASLGTLVLVLQASFGVGVIASLDSSDLDIEYGSGTFGALSAIEAEAIDKRPPPHVGFSSSSAPSEITFHDIHFTYPASRTPTLRGVNLTIRGGATTAIVGLNGAGKTTLVRLLAGIDLPLAGHIAVDGVDLSDLSIDAWRRRLAIIFQDFVHYELSARDNITFGSILNHDDHSALSRATTRAGAANVVSALRDGWETILSRQHENGAELSGGQWQRIALARALFAVETGASLLVLDEPTANLDVRAEAAFLDSFLGITRDLTTVLISHRLSSVRRADQIYVLDGGRVAESGTHDELLAADAAYAKMYRQQASRFEDRAPTEPGQDGLAQC